MENVIDQILGVSQETDSYTSDIERKAERAKAKKMARIKMKAARIYGVIDQIRLAYYNAMETFSKHRAAVLFMVVLLAGAVILHGISTRTVLNVFFPAMNPYLLLSMGMMIALGLESLSVFLYSKHSDFLSHFISAFSLFMILGIAVWEYLEHGTSIYNSGLRGLFGSVFLVGALAIVHHIRSLEDSKKRIKYEWHTWTIKRAIDKALLSASPESPANWQDLCNVFKITSTSLRDRAVKLGVYSHANFKQFPKRRNRRVKKEGRIKK